MEIEDRVAFACKYLPDTKVRALISEALTVVNVQCLSSPYHNLVKTTNALNLEDKAVTPKKWLLLPVCCLEI